MDEIALVPYDPAWPRRFREEAALLRQLLPGDLITRLEHFGSTAVPGLDAKPIIDMLMGTPSLEYAIREAVPLLEDIGYSFWQDNPAKDRLFLVKGLPPSAPQRTHHLHIVEPDSVLWERVNFVAYLRAHPEETARYAALKHDLAARFATDREAYTAAKTDYMREVMDKVRREFA